MFSCPSFFRCTYCYHCNDTLIFLSVRVDRNAPINVKPQGGGRAGYSREIVSARFSLGGDFDIRVLPWGREFDIATTCFGQKAVPRGGNLTFSRCPGVGNLTLALVKMSNSPGSARPPLPWGFTLIGA